MQLTLMVALLQFSSMESSQSNVNNSCAFPNITSLLGKNTLQYFCSPSSALGFTYPGCPVEVKALVSQSISQSTKKMINYLENVFIV